MFLAPALSIILAQQLLCPCVGLAQAPTFPPAVEGYVTSVSSATDFSVEGFRVVCVAKTKFVRGTDVGSTNLPWNDGPYIGQALSVFGRKIGKTHAIEAREIRVGVESYIGKDGSGVIDRVFLPSGGHTDQLVVRADGYPILISAKTAIRFIPPLKTLSDITTNHWLTYKGELQPEGFVVASSATFAPNTVGGSEQKLRTKNEYDPARVDPKNKQGAFSKAFLGIDGKRLPPYKDPEMQARVERIGASLVPEYQRKLAKTDPSKIDFRFQLVKAKMFNSALAAPSGIILVPIHIAARMQNDAQLAAILADSMASIVEKREYLDAPAVHTLQVIGWASLPGIAIGSIGDAVITREEQEQSGRVSLGFLSDAGYDIYQAPLAWWCLASKKPKSVTEISIPTRARYLYQILGSVWKDGKMTFPGNSGPHP
jgi:hypothetical protein